MKKSPGNTVILLCFAISCLAAAAKPPSTANEQRTVPADLIRFHGHECPGVTIGYRMVSEAMKALPPDVKLVAIVENRSCGVDALQWITGCTAGKGNLIFKDYGKQAYTLYSAETKKGVRVVFNGQKVPDEIKNDKAAFIKWLLTTEAKVFLTLQPVEVNEPETVKTKESAPCSICGEAVNLTHLRDSGGNKACIPCMEKRTATAK